MQAFAIATALAFSSTCLADLTFESRLSRLTAQSRRGGNDFNNYSGFAAFDGTATVPGAFTSQTSSLAADAIIFRGYGTGEGSGGPGQPSGSGNSSMEVVFIVSSSSSWSFVGETELAFPAGGGFSLVSLSTGATVFDYFHNDGVRDWNGSGMLAAGRYRFTASIVGGDGGFALGSGTLTVIPSASTPATAFLAALAGARRRRRQVPSQEKSLGSSSNRA